MKHPSYPKYKKSGVAWLGNVPEHWEIKRLKYILQEPLQYGANEAAELDDPELPRFVRITDVDESGNLRDETFRSLPEEVAKPFLLDEGDLLFARSGATVGKTFFYRKTWGRAAYAGYLIRARVKKSMICPDYINFITKSSFYSQWISSVMIQATIQNVSAEKYASYVIPFPPIQEQQAIAAFLDCETGRIDTLIGKKQRFVELLKEKRTALISHAVTKGLNPKIKMKPSGVNWLGDVPEHWDVKRMKHLGAIRYGLGEPPEYVDDGLPFIRATDINRGRVEMDLVKKIRPEDVPWSRNPQLKLNEILVVRSGAYTGDSAIITSNVANCIAGYDMVYTPMKAYAPFMAWVLLSKYMLNGQIYLERMRAAQPHLNAEELGNFVVMLPPLPEQQAIADFLDYETGKIDVLMAKVETAIETLKEYRTALISAAVTGKIDVREVA